ncbi:KdsC family phosphatase [Helicobacter bizzozeronii]|uniref:KdsC family phosphatase n=1 Tax=Helicobacter bizzozeronii TaxID=56877 RepID=UPI000CEE2D8C|nr:HAD-IIIA family hydrolase [Helicobacter bizzozeronii]
MNDIKVFLCDCDGTLTDGGMYYLENGAQFKKFSVADGIGFELLKARGIKIGILTGEVTPIVEQRAKRLKMDYLYQGCTPEGKLEALQEICAQEHITPAQVAYVGDDINDLLVLEHVGFKGCVANAHPHLKALSGIVVSTKSGGEGGVRALIDLWFGNPRVLKKS